MRFLRVPKWTGNITSIILAPRHPRTRPSNINARQTTTLYYIHFLRTVITCAYLNAYICSYSDASTMCSAMGACVWFYRRIRCIYYKPYGRGTAIWTGHYGFERKNEDRLESVCAVDKKRIFGIVSVSLLVVIIIYNTTGSKDEQLTCIIILFIGIL